MAQRGAAIGAWQRAKFEVLGFLDRRTSIFRAQVGLRGHRDLCVSPSTDLVIEGFPRSGNTYAVAAFRLAQPGPVRLARHLHSHCQVVLALRWGIPALVLTRALPDPVLSMMVREPSLTAAQLLRAYAIFHERLAPLRARIVVADFEEVVSDFGTVIERVNARFGRSFARYERSEAAEAKVRAAVEEMDRLDTGGAEVVESGVARPSREREARKAALRERYDATALAALRERAEAARRELLG